MTDAEWESLCDGCGQCCLHKLVNDETKDVFYTRVACQLLDDQSGQCKRYVSRLDEVEDCLDVRRMSHAGASMDATQLRIPTPRGGSHRHGGTLITGDPQSTANARMTVAGRTISETAVDLDQLEAEIIEWVDI